MKIQLPPGSDTWAQLRAGQKRRGRSVREVLPDVPKRHADAARRFWSTRAWSEYAAVPAVSQIVLALTREGAGLHVLGAYTAVASDEVRHAQLSRELAELYGGYVDTVPEGFAYDPMGLASPSDVPVTVWALSNGCYSETVSLALIRARFSRTKHPAAHFVLNETLKDEAVHVRLGWQLAEELLPVLSRGQRRGLAEYGEALAQMLRSTFGTSALPPGPRRRERAIRDRTAALGLGALSADEEDAVVEEALSGVAERLHRLGISRRA
ncbi:MAG: ferritin-like domain-containing protein [Myxococcaceae bacterium]|nr:ferritin-like domain-containing protein [Myxococcaceae bacterium]